MYKPSKKRSKQVSDMKQSSGEKDKKMRMRDHHSGATYIESRDPRMASENQNTK